jgi:protein ImuB
MCKRFVSLWFRHLTTDWISRRRPELKGTPFVLVSPIRGRMVITAASIQASEMGIEPGTVLADAKAVLPSLQYFEEDSSLPDKLLKNIAEWCIRYTPYVAIDGSDGLFLDATGCTHLWGGEQQYLKELLTRLREAGFNVRASIADTVGAAWAISHYGRIKAIIEPGGQLEAISKLPPACLRLDGSIEARLHKLGFYHLHSVIKIPRTSLRRRFGQTLLDRIDQAIGLKKEPLQPIIPIIPYSERLPCLEPVRTATAIEIALKNLLDSLCKRLHNESKGLRTAKFKCQRIDRQWQHIEIGTNRPVRNREHLFRLFEQKIEQIAPGLGIELFILEAPVVEKLPDTQEALWYLAQESTEVANLLDRIAGRLGPQTIHRYLPAEHYWPERSYKLASSIREKTENEWPIDHPRPVILLPTPEIVEVSAPIPDYPPMLFRWRGRVHNIKKADGVERIESEWWLDKGLHRDYYRVEDQAGARYWLFRLGHYGEGLHKPQWFLHGFFA